MTNHEALARLSFLKLKTEFEMINSEKTNNWEKYFEYCFFIHDINKLIKEIKRKYK